MDEVIVRNNNNNKELVKSRSQSTSLAEEAVDQLQASEKLIAGMEILSVNSQNFIINCISFR